MHICILRSKYFLYHLSGFILPTPRQSNRMATFFMIQDHPSYPDKHLVLVDSQNEVGCMFVIEMLHITATAMLFWGVQFSNKNMSTL